jgi:hypothetical protein
MSTTTVTPRQPHTQSLVRRHPLFSFFVLTYAVTWSLWIPLVIFGDRVPSRLGFVLTMLGSLVPSATGFCLSASSAADPACAHCSHAYCVPGSACAITWRCWP